RGEFYRFEKALSDVLPVNGTSIPIYGGGGSDAAIELLSSGLDTFMVWGEPLADTEVFFDRVRSAALPERTDIGFSVSTLLIRGYEPLADAEEYGRELIPRVREIVAERARARRSVGAART